MLFFCLFLPLLAFGFISRAPPSEKWRLGSLDNHPKIQKRGSSRYYRDGSTLVLLPKFQRQRNARIAVLDKASKAPDYSVKELLDMLSRIQVGQKLENIDAVFASICKWFYFKHKELINDPNFPQLRETLRRTHYIFGRIYSRVIKRLCKFRNCFEAACPLRDVGIYIMYRDKELLEYSNLSSIINDRVIKKNGPVPSTVLPRVHALFQGILDKDEKIQLMKKHVVRFNEAVRAKKTWPSRQVAQNPPPRFITSTFGTFLHALLEETRLPQNERIEMISDICRFDFGVSRRWLQGLTVVDAHNVNTWAYTALADLSAQIYRLFIEAEKYPMDPSVANEACILSEDVSDTLELGAMYFYTRLRALASINDRDALITELLRQLAEFAGFLNVVVQETQKSGHRHYKVAMLRELLFGEYLRRVIFNVHGCDSVIFSRLNALYKSSNGKSDVGEVQVVPSQIGKCAYTAGMSNLCSILKYTPPRNMFDPKSQKQVVWGILKGKESVHLYNFEQDTIAASMDVQVMDAYNSGNRNVLDPNDHTWSNENVIDRIQSIMDSLEAPFGPLKFNKLAMLHLPLLQSPVVEPFKGYMINGTNGKMVQHPIYAYLSFVVHEWAHQR